jgi:putative acetyltransferase
MQIAFESPNQPEVIALIDALDAYQKPLYPVESFHGIDITALSQSNILFAVARSATHQAVGCAALSLNQTYAELKRMYVIREYRGQGIGKQLIEFLETTAIKKGHTHFMLETGYLQTEALNLYQRCGYIRRSPFGDYIEDQNSVFMEKRLT